MCVCTQSCPALAAPWTVAHQSPLSMGFSRQEYWSGLPFSSPGDHPDPGMEHPSLMSPALAGGFVIIVLPGKPRKQWHHLKYQRSYYLSIKTNFLNHHHLFTSSLYLSYLLTIYIIYLYCLIFNYFINFYTIILIYVCVTTMDVKLARNR